MRELSPLRHKYSLAPCLIFHGYIMIWWNFWGRYQNPILKQIKNNKTKQNKTKKQLPMLKMNKSRNLLRKLQILYSVKWTKTGYS